MSKLNELLDQADRLKSKLNRYRDWDQKTVQEALNHYEAVEMIRDLAHQKTEIINFSLLSLHALILRGIDKDHTGQLRQVPVMISGRRHTPPQPGQSGLEL